MGQTGWIDPLFIETDSLQDNKYRHGFPER